MIDFACKKFNLNDVIKCGLGLTRSEFKIMGYFSNHRGTEVEAGKIALDLDLNLTTVQKGVKKLFERGIIARHQRNLENGGYVYFYKCNSKVKVRGIIKDLVRSWADKVDKEIDRW